MRVLGVTCSFVVAIVFVALTAADTQAQGVIIESYAGARPDDAGELFGPLTEVLAKRGVTSATSGLVKKIDEGLSRPAALVTQEHLDTAAKLVSKGEKTITRGLAAPAVKILQAAVDVYTAQSAAVARDIALRDLSFRARVALAVAQQQVGLSDAARDVMSELIRSFPQRDLSGSTLASKANKLHADLTAELAKKATGSIAITSTDSAAEIYVNERSVGTGTATAGKLPPGTYRVHLQKAGVAGRLHLVKVKANQKASLAVNWELDATLKTSTDYVGLEFANEKTRIRGEKKVAVALANALRVGEIVVLGLRDRDGKRSIVGAVYSAGGTLLLAASARLEPVATGADRARSLASYLAGDAPSSDISVMTEVKGAGKTALKFDPNERENRAKTQRWKWIALGTGTALFVTGLTFVVLDGNGSCGLSMDQTQCPRLYDTALMGWGGIATGAALIGTGVWLWMKGNKTEEKRAIGLVPTRGGAAVSLSARF